MKNLDKILHNIAVGMFISITATIAAVGIMLFIFRVLVPLLK